MNYSKLLALIFLIALACDRTLSSQNTFLYFSYGSNMLTKRIHMNNPSAKSVAIARLKDYHLDFVWYNPSLHGSVSTIVPSENSEVWGVVWEIDIADMANLDRQEAVKDGIYFPKTVSVKTPAGEYLECRTYQHTDSTNTFVSPSELPPERQPSFKYMKSIIDGAKEHDIPLRYVEFLQSFRDNGYRGETNFN